jgi:hypothetical protein
MSSHHFVKEGQEPALFIYEAISFSQVESLLEWAPLVITRSSQVERVINWGIKIDVVLLDSDDNTIDEMLRTQFPVQKVVLPQNVDIMQGLRSVLEADHQRNITIATGDASSLMRDWRPADDIDAITIIDTKNRWLGIAHQSFSKWYPASTTLVLFPEQVVSTVNGEARSANTITTVGDGVVSIFRQSFFWVGELL